MEERKVWHPDDRCWVPCLVLGSVPKGNQGVGKACQLITRGQNAPTEQDLHTPASQLTNQSVRSLLGQTDCCDGAEFWQRLKLRGGVWTCSLGRESPLGAGGMRGAVGWSRAAGGGRGSGP